MLKNLSQTIKRFRQKDNFSQEYLAKELGISRPTYLQIEKGERELTISEAEKLAAIFGFSLENFLKGKNSEIKINFEKRKKKKKERCEMRISVPQKNLEKFKEVFLYILEKVGARPNIGETALYKLLYFIDFDYYEKYEEQLIGATYIKNHYGPTPLEFKKIVEQMQKDKEVEKIKSKFFQYEQKKYLPHRAPDLSKLTAQEIVHIDNVLNHLSGKTAKELSDYSHADTPWLVHKMGEKISYESVFYRDDDHSVRTYNDEL